MTEKYDPELISRIREATPKKIAEELCSVQPITCNIDWDALEQYFQALHRVSGCRCPWPGVEHKHD